MARGNRAAGNPTHTQVVDTDATVGSADITDGSIAAVDLAADSVDSDEIATGAVDPDHVAGLAHTADTVRVRTPMLMTVNYTASSFDANDDIILTFPAGHDVLVLDMFINQTTAEGGALTGTLYDTANAGGTAISAAVDLNSTAKTVLRPTTFAPTAVSASGAVYLNASGNPATTAGAVNLLYVHTT